VAWQLSGIGRIQSLVLSLVAAAVCDAWCFPSSIPFRPCFPLSRFSLFSNESLTEEMADWPGKLH
jgi:hypothetical protein